MIHQFEKAGLGKAPFHLVNVESKYFEIPGHPETRKPGASCEFCGRPIAECCIIEDANGKRFHVGNECVKKTGDAGLIDSISRNLARLRREKKAALSEELRKECKLLLATPKIFSVLSATPHKNEYYASQGKTMLDYYQFMVENASQSRVIYLLRELKTF
jgi:hypothetical protein